MPVEVGKAVQVSLSNLSFYLLEEIYATVSPIVDRSDALQNIDEAHRPRLGQVVQ